MPADPTATGCGPGSGTSPASPPRPASRSRSCHYPPGTSKWNKIEHRLFSFISMNWRGRPLTDIRTIVELIAATTTTAPVSPCNAPTTRTGTRPANTSATPTTPRSRSPHTTGTANGTTRSLKQSRGEALVGGGQALPPAPSRCGRVECTLGPGRRSRPSALTVCDCKAETRRSVLGGRVGAQVVNVNDVLEGQSGSRSNALIVSFSTRTSRTCRWVGRWCGSSLSIWGT